MSEITNKAIRSVSEGLISMSKFITPNDVGATGGHQSGFHIHKSTFSVFFDTPGMKGSNLENFINIKWQDNFVTESRAIYYGTGTRNEYRLTRFGRGFPFLTEDNIGDLLVMTKRTDCEYEAFVLTTDDEMEIFFDTFGMSPTDTNAIINKDGITGQATSIRDILISEASAFTVFPKTTQVSEIARRVFNSMNRVSAPNIKAHPDALLLNWIETEYELFLILENQLCSDVLKTQFNSTEEFIQAANSIANRRKSRAGKSLELHLEEIFKVSEIMFETQVYTEDKKQPDFVFPGSVEYHNPEYPNNKLVMLASKTTCKDRWRQVLNEADRIGTKHLFTLQQGISKNQLNEMYQHGIHLVVPQAYVSSFPIEYRDRISPLDDFIEYVSGTQR
jgi:type II restriction enzyme